MPTSKTSLNEMLYDVKRIAEHREVLSEKKIRSIYSSLMKDLRAFLGESYEKYSDSDGRFYLSYLDAQNKRAKFLQEIAESVDTISPKLKKEMLDLVEDTYKRCYEGMSEAVRATETRRKLVEATKDLTVQPDELKQAVNNNIDKLTLPAVMEKHRAEVIYQVQQALTIGLINGDRYEQMAKRISERVGVSETKARNIARTESHRNVESGFMDCAEHIQKGIDGSDYIYAATWHNMGDERVRPQQRRKTKKGWKTVLSRNGANHIIMEGQTVKVGDEFDLGGGVKAKAPSKSGVAAHDCNCRCFLEYNLMTIEEFEKASGKSVRLASINSKAKTLMNKNGISDCDLERITDNQRFSKAVDAARKANPHGGAVDPVPPEQAAQYKCYLAKNNMAGVAVKSDGDITAVFKNSDWKQRGAVNDLIITARANGGTKMDCYGIDLVNKYERCGYVPVAKVKFNPDFVDDPWLLQTKPDVYFLMKNTDSIETVIEKNAKKAYKLSTQEELNKLPVFDDIVENGETKWGYDRAYAHRDSLLSKQG